MLLTIGVLLAPVVGWLLTAGLAYAVSKLFDPAPALRRFLALVGWGHLPLVIPAVAIVTHLGVVLARAPRLSTRLAAEIWVRNVIMTSPVRLAIELVGPVFAIWAVTLWLLAAEEALDLSRRRAVLCVALPGLITLLDSVGGAVSVLAG